MTNVGEMKEPVGEPKHIGQYDVSEAIHVSWFRFLWCRILHRRYLIETEYRSGYTLTCVKCGVEHYWFNIWY